MAIHKIEEVRAFLKTEQGQTLDGIRAKLSEPGIDAPCRTILMKAMRIAAQNEAEDARREAEHKEKIASAAPVLAVPGIDAAQKELAEPETYTGDDFTDREDYQETGFGESDRIQADDPDEGLPTLPPNAYFGALAKCMETVARQFPTDIPVRQVSDRAPFLPWERILLSLLLGWCDTIARQLYKTFRDNRTGEEKASGLYIVLQQRKDECLRLMADRRLSDQQIDERKAEVADIEHRIEVLEGMLEQAADVYDRVAAQSEIIQYGDTYFPGIYMKPSERANKAIAASQTPMTGAEYEAWVQFEGKEKADAEWARRNAAPADKANGNAKVTTFTKPDAAADPLALVAQMQAQQAVMMQTIAALAGKAPMPDLSALTDAQQRQQESALAQQMLRRDARPSDTLRRPPRRF